MAHRTPGYLARTIAAWTALLAVPPIGGSLLLFLYVDAIPSLLVLGSFDAVVVGVALVAIFGMGLTGLAPTATALGTGISARLDRSHVILLGLLSVSIVGLWVQVLLRPVLDHGLFSPVSTFRFLPWVYFAVGICTTGSVFAYGYHQMTRVQPSRYLGRSAVDATVRRLAQTVDVPTPTVRVVNVPVPNSLAVGRRGNATILVTQGLVDVLDENELEAVLARELAQIANHDTLVMTVAGSLTTVSAGIIASMARVSEYLSSESPTSTRDRWTPETQPEPMGLYGFLYPFLITPVLVVTLPVLFGGVLAFSALARTRVLNADRTAAEITGDPSSLAVALRRLDDTPTPSTASSDGSRVTRYPPELCLLPGGFGAGASTDIPPDEVVRSETPLGRFLSTHPPIDARVSQLRRHLRAMAED